MKIKISTAAVALATASMWFTDAHLVPKLITTAALAVMIYTEFAERRKAAQ